ncbi:hypothetical protein [Pseudomonas sp. CC120222-01a]|uniref:hypothetical protein n=1 Tax=Pseudomonas sp. CC120222-01a TaxID=1378075 RepID=UPI000DA1D445|nr:hypothetical protein [Pseudomonas sp. CC120222-01a]
MNMFEPGLVVLLGFSFGIITLLVLVYVACTHIDRVESFFEGSKYVQGVKEAFSNAGMPGKVLRICSIACLLTLPGPYVRRGLANGEEVKKFPRSMRRMLIGLWLALTFEILAMLAFRVWLYFV